jgi:hypothetical protein
MVRRVFLLVFTASTLAFARPRHTVTVSVRPAPASLVAAATTAAKAAPLAQGREATRDLLLAIAEHESSFRESIVRCHVRGDNGRAHGAYQLHTEAFGDHSAGEVCASDALQARLALTVLRQYMKMFPHLGIVGAVRGYASGRPRQDTAAAREILALWKARRAGHRRR